MSANNTVSVYGKIPPRYILEGPKAQRQQVGGLVFPLGSSNSGGFFSRKTGVAMIRDAVRQLLQTERGERVMLPNFGCNLRKYLFQPLSETTFESIKREIQFSFRKYIVGANIERLAVYPTGDAGPAGGNSLKVVLSLKLDTADLEQFDVEVNIS
jgi:phage baseplate assembly protein W